VLVAGEDLAKGGGTRPVVATKKGRGEKERKKKGERERWTGEREKKGEQSERNGTSSRRLLYSILFPRQRDVERPRPRDDQPSNPTTSAR
jgi:hypothetical protein